MRASVGEALPLHFRILLLQTPGIALVQEPQGYSKTVQLVWLSETGVTGDALDHAG